MFDPGSWLRVDGDMVHDIRNALKFDVVTDSRQDEKFYSVRFRFLFFDSLGDMSGSESEESEEDGGNEAWAPKAAS